MTRSDSFGSKPAQVEEEERSGSGFFDTPVEATLVLDQGTRWQWRTSSTAVRDLQSPDGSFRRAMRLYDVTQLRLHHAHRPWFDGRPRRWKACAYLKLTTGPVLDPVGWPRSCGARLRELRCYQGHHSPLDGVPS